VRVAFHVDENDAATMNMTLNNAANVIAYYQAQGTPTEIEVVTYGPGLNMLIEGESPVADRIAAMSLEHESLSFSACANTMAGMEKKTGAPVVLISEAKITPSGVVRLVELQGQGYAYIKP
jgi:intracellular sulfur oxidation DsrE/DsrF family protein